MMQNKKLLFYGTLESWFSWVFLFGNDLMRIEWPSNVLVRYGRLSVGLLERRDCWAGIKQKCHVKVGGGGRRAFSVAGLMFWNSLPNDLRVTELGANAFRR